MKKNLLYVFGFLALAPLLLTIVNIAQNGSSTPDGRIPAEILGVSVAQASVNDVAQLSKADIMQLFYTLDPPTLNELNGEYNAVLLDVGVLSLASAWYTHNLFGDGHWLGKGLRSPTNPGTGRQSGGYNLFAGSDAENNPAQAATRRLRKFDTFRGSSLLDARESFHLDYHAYNGGTIQSMRDEIRRINDRLYLGMGHMALGGGAINPAPFLLLGPPIGPARDQIQAADGDASIDAVDTQP